VRLAVEKILTEAGFTVTGDLAGEDLLVTRELEPGSSP
jgi:hypothetical protein